MKVRNNWMIALAVILVAVLYLGSLGSVKVSAAEMLAEQPELLTDYMLGETVTVPQSTLLIDGQEHPAMAVVYQPDGTAVTDSQIVLTQTGIYTVQYKAKVNSWWYSECVQFNVTSQPLNITGSPSSTYSYNTDKDTIALNLAQRDSFNFNHPINLNGKTKNDALISMYVTSQEVNVRDFEKIVVVLTDAYDPTNKVYIRLMGDWANITRPDDFSSDDPNNIYRYSRYQSYISANFDGSKTWSFWNWQSEKHEIVSQYGGGLAVYFSLCNEANVREGCQNMTQEQDLYILSYDAATNSLYHLGATPYPTQRLIADLDDPEFFGGQFKGFTNNEVYISVYAEDVYTSANITVTDIAYNGKLDDKVVDSTVPALAVDCAPYAQDAVPAAIVGKPYNIYPATVRDINIYNSDITKEVFLNYGTENQVAVDLVDGAFIAAVAGEYTIVYTKIDAFGNVGKQIVAVTAVADAQPIQLQVADFKAVAGVAQKIDVPLVLTSDTRTGRLTLTITAERNDTKETVYQGYLDEYEPVAYRFMMAGQWQVSYTVADHTQSDTKTVVCQADAGTSLIYDRFEDLQIDKTILTGSTYYLPTVKVVSFTDTEAVYTDAKIKINYGDKWQPVVSNRFTVTEEMGDFLLITYYDENNPDCAIYGTRSITNIGANGSYQLGKLFNTENATLTATSNYLSFTAERNASVEMITKQNAENLSLVFQLNSKGQSFRKLNILLTDSVDEDIQLRITLENLAKPIESSYLPTSYSSMYLNGDTGTTLNLQAGFVDSQKYYGLSYANLTQTVSCTDISDSKNGLTATSCVNGDAFTGFPSGMVFISFEMEAAGASPELMLYSVNSQSMSSFQEDFFSPAIAVKGSYASTYQINQTVSTVTAHGIDVINGFCNAQITVSRIDGGIVSTVDGRLLEKLDATKSYDFIADKYGEYVVYYYSKDANGNTNDSVYYSFYVEDVEKPSIELVSGAQQTVWTGTEFVMPDLKVSDNRSTVLYPTAVIENPDGRRNAVSDEPYIFDMEGSYKVNIVVYDEEGNRAQISYYVEVVRK